jgi:hypothetical protein
MVTRSPKNLIAQAWKNWAFEPKGAVGGIRELLCAGRCNRKETNKGQETAPVAILG